jgi:hypothetical protein
MDDQSFVIAAQNRVGAPISAITPESRCLGRAKNCQPYRAENLATVPGTLKSGQHGRPYTLREHEDATHWLGCPCGGISIHGHNAVVDAICRLLRPIGYQVSQKELFLAMGPKTKKYPQGKAEYADALARNFMAGQGIGIAIDGSITNSLSASVVRRSARADHAATALRERAKHREKEQLAKSRHLQFLAAAVDSFSAIGVEFAKVVNAGYAAKVESAQTDQEKWEIIAEKQRGMTLLSMAVQRRNAAVILQSAHPLGGGYASTALKTERDEDMLID